MPDGRLLRACHFRYLDREQEFRQPEEPLQHLVEGKVLLELFFGIIIGPFAQTFRRVGDVPGFEPLPQRARLLFRRFCRGSVQLADHLLHRRDRRRAFGDDGKFRRIPEPQQVRALEAQLQDLRYPRRILRRTGGPPPVKRLANLPVRAHLHRLGIVRVVDGVGLAVLLVTEGIRRVQDGIREIHGKLRQPRRDLVESRAFVFRQRHARQLDALDELLQNPDARFVARRIPAGLHARKDVFRLRKQNLGLSHAKRKGNDLRLELLLDLAPGGRIAHARHERDVPPRPPEFARGVVEPPDEILVGGRLLPFDFRYAFLGLGQETRQFRRAVLRCDLGPIGKCLALHAHTPLLSVAFRSSTCRRATKRKAP